MKGKIQCIRTAINQVKRLEFAKVCVVQQIIGDLVKFYSLWDTFYKAVERINQQVIKEKKDRQSGTEFN